MTGDTRPGGDARPRVLVVDDDRAVRDSLERALGTRGFRVDVAEDGLAALTAIESATPDIVILDVMMPGVDGLALLRRLRQDGNDIPILMVTARDGVPDRVAGLTAGADDYLVKPFALEELVARLHSLLRRQRGTTDRNAVRVLRFADLAVDLDRIAVTRDGEPIELTRTEFDLLVAFIEQPGRVLTRDVLQQVVWGSDHEVTPNAVEVYVGYLRRKLEVGGRPRLIQTVRGFGYALREPS